MIRRLLPVVSAVVAVLLGPPVGLPTAHAGGWAVTSLDPLPLLSPGKPAVIEFTILQHGRSPVHVDDVTIEIGRPNSNVVESFTAQPGDGEGRYVVTVVFPESGEYEWTILQGWFGPQDLGTVRLSDGTGGVERSSLWPAGLRYVLLAASVGLIGLGARESLRNRRRMAAA